MNDKSGVEWAGTLGGRVGGYYIGQAGTLSARCRRELTAHKRASWFRVRSRIGLVVGLALGLLASGRESLSVSVSGRLASPCLQLHGQHGLRGTVRVRDRVGTMFFSLGA